MPKVLDPFRFLLIAVAGRMNQRQLQVIGIFARGESCFANNSASGACGADTLFAEACLERGVRVLLLIPLPEDLFLERSVRFADADWEPRYRTLRASCEARFQQDVLGPLPEDEDAFERNNLWSLDTAYALVPADRVDSILVWDEKPSGDGPGGTSHFASRVARGAAR